MNKKVVGIIVAFVVLVVGAFVGITMTTTSPSSSNEVDASGKGDSASGDKAAAEELMSQDDVEDSVGKWADFEMSSEGCERGVYAGIFYYDNFTIFSRTYDKGQTYHIVSVN